MPSITVKDDGTVVFMYETYDGGSNTVHVHVAASDDFGASVSNDVDEYSFTPLTLPQATGSTTSNREFGDYLYITSVGNEFFGTFAARGDVNAGGVDTTGLVDPFFFSGFDVPEPGSLSVLLAGLAGVGLRWRTRRPGAAAAR